VRDGFCGSGVECGVMPLAQEEGKLSLQQLQ